MTTRLIAGQDIAWGTRYTGRVVVSGFDPKDPYHRHWLKSAVGSRLSGDARVDVLGYPEHSIVTKAAS